MFKTHHQSFLKVKIKSLAEEARIIRLEEKKAFPNEKREQLYQHRVYDVRQESRAALLAYAYLRGRDLLQIEPNSKESWQRHKVYKRAHKIVKKFGTQDAYDNFETWLKASA